MESSQTQLPGISPAPSKHLAMAELVAGLARLPIQPKDSGRVALIVRRTGVGVHEEVGSALFTAEHGLPGDRWRHNPPANPEAQLAVMRRVVAELIANGRPLILFGDNLFVDLDISMANLPVGSRLRVGKAMMEVTPMPHNGCKKFHSRFGADALKFVNAKETRDQNLRGIYWRVMEPGEVNIGAKIEIISR